jgi:hypothetical protein
MSVRSAVVAGAGTNFTGRGSQVSERGAMLLELVCLTPSLDLQESGLGSPEPGLRPDRPLGFNLCLSPRLRMRKLLLSLEDTSEVQSSRVATRW